MKHAASNVHRQVNSFINYTTHFQSTPVATQIQRKKSMPDFQALPNASTGMSREEVSVLSSAQREQVRRGEEEKERLRANPLLYLVSPHVKVSTKIQTCEQNTNTYVALLMKCLFTGVVFKATIINVSFIRKYIVSHRIL